MIRDVDLYRKPRYFLVVSALLSRQYGLISAPFCRNSGTIHMDSTHASPIKKLQSTSEQ